MKKRKKLANIKETVICGMFYSLWGFILLFVMLLLFATVGHCASQSGPKFPILVENIDIAPYQTYINNTYGGFWNLSQNNVIGWGSQENGYYAQTFAIPQVQEQIASYLSFSPASIDYSYPDFDYHNNTITLTFTNLNNDNYKPWRIVTFYTNGNNGPGYPYAAAFNTANNINKGVYGNTGSVLNYVSSDIYLTSLGSFVVNQPIFVNELPAEPEIPFNTGHATPPDELQGPLYTTGHTPPANVPPSVTINNYNWTTYNPPSIDDTDIISTLKSLIYVVNYLAGWLKDNLVGQFSNLINNLKNLFDYIGQTIQYYGDLIIGNIHNAINTFYNNMVSLFEPIAETIGSINEPLDVEEVKDRFENTQLVEDYDRIGQLIDDAFGFFDDISEPNTFSIALDLTHISLLNQTRIFYIDFGWYNGCKQVIRGLMWTLTTFGLLYTIIDSIPDYLHGNDE